MNNEQLRRALGRRLAEARARAGLSQADLGRVIGVSGPRVSHFESGHSLPKVSYRIPIAKAVKANPSVLFGPEVYLPRSSRGRPLGAVSPPVPKRKEPSVPRRKDGSAVSKQIMRPPKT